MGNDASSTSSIEGLKSDVAALNKIVRDGNGQPSLMQQVSTLNNSVRNLENNWKSELAEIKESIVSNHNDTMEKSGMAWQFKAAILVALISSFTSIFLNWQERTLKEPAVNQQTLTEILHKLDKLTQEKKN